MIGLSVSLAKCRMPRSHNQAILIIAKWEQYPVPDGPRPAPKLGPAGVRPVRVEAGEIHRQSDLLSVPSHKTIIKIRQRSPLIEVVLEVSIASGFIHGFPTRITKPCAPSSPRP